jgi:hypothetical protein
MAPQPHPNPSGASTLGKTPQNPATKAHNLRQRSKVDCKDLNTGASQFGRAEFRKRCSKAGASVRKSVAKVIKMSLTKLFPPISRNSSSSRPPQNDRGMPRSGFGIRAYEQTHQNNFHRKIELHQCFNIPSGHRFAFKINQSLPHINLWITNKLMASIIEEHFHYMDLYANFLNQKIERMEFANTKWIQMHLAKSIKENCRRILMALAILAVIGKVI